MTQADTLERTRDKPKDQVEAWVRDSELDDAAYFHDQEMARYGASGFPMQFDNTTVRAAHKRLSDAYYEVQEARKAYRQSLIDRVRKLMEPPTLMEEKPRRDFTWVIPAAFLVVIFGYLFYCAFNLPPNP